MLKVSILTIKSHDLLFFLHFPVLFENTVTPLLVSEDNYHLPLIATIFSKENLWLTSVTDVF